MKKLHSKDFSIKLRTGLDANLPALKKDISQGEPALCTDTGRVVVALTSAGASDATLTEVATLKGNPVVSAASPTLDMTFNNKVIPVDISTTVDFQVADDVFTAGFRCVLLVVTAGANLSLSRSGSTAAINDGTTKVFTAPVAYTQVLVCCGEDNKLSASLLPQLGTTAGTACEGNDPRLEPSVFTDTRANIEVATLKGVYYASDTKETFFNDGSNLYKLPVSLTSFFPGAIPGAHPDQLTGPRVTGYGSFLLLQGANGFLVGADGTKYQFVFSAIDTDEAYDAEGAIDGDNVLGHGASQQYSLVSGNSDSGNPYPAVKNFQTLKAGSQPPPMVMSAGGDNPSAKLFNRNPIRNRDFVGDIGKFLLYSTQGEDGFNTTAPSAILDADGDQLDSNLTQYKKFTTVRSAARTLSGTSFEFDITSANNSGSIRFTVSGTDLTTDLAVGDHVYVHGSDGVSVNGKHRITAISFSTDTTIDVNTSHQVGDATKGRLRACARLEQITSTAI